MPVPAYAISSGADNFIGDNDAGQKTTYAYIQSKSTDVSDGTEDGDVRFFTRGAGTFKIRHGQTENNSNTDCGELNAVCFGAN